MVDFAQSFDIQALLSGYREGRFRPAEILDLARARIEAAMDHHVWITRLTPEQLRPYVERLDRVDPAELPLYGIPFAIKDNIDLAGTPTTAACPEFSYIPEQSAPVVEALIYAGALPLGKTNLDQFATGLVGVRSPYGPCRNSFDSDYIAGGSSSGSAVAVALGQASFSLGTDTAGSGRVPAAFNNLVGVKPSKGLLSTRGVVPACRSLDCVSIFTLCAKDAARVFDQAASFDSEDPFARPAGPPPIGDVAARERFRFGMPRADQLLFFGNVEGGALFEQSVERLQALGGNPVEIDFAPFLAAARLLYEGPWLAERYLAVQEFIEAKPEALFPVTREIIAAGARYSATDAFSARYRLAELRRTAEDIWRRVDVMLAPTAGTVYRIDEVEADPLRLNGNLGYYTNFMNLLDLCAVALPAGFQATGIPFGVTLFAPAHSDQPLLELADRLHRASGLQMGAGRHPLPEPDISWTRQGRQEWMPLVVCGAHMEGLPLNPQLTERGGRLVRRTRTRAAYRLYALETQSPPRPCLVRDSEGAAIEVEIWELPVETVGSFLAMISRPLGLGKVELAGGDLLPGFICEGAGAGAVDITHLGGWRAYLKRTTG